MRNLTLLLVAATLVVPEVTLSTPSAIPFPDVPAPWGFDSHRIIYDGAYRNLDDDVLSQIDDHVVCDIHQPLHAYGGYRGGNDVRVLVDGENYSLHSYWDSGFLIRKGGDWQRIARSLGHGISRIDRALWTSLEPEVWANESFRIVEDQVYVSPLSAEVEDEYRFRNIQTVEEQLQKAGFRLALLLNEILATNIIH